MKVPPGAVCIECPDYDLVLACPEDCGENACEKAGGYCRTEEKCPADFAESNLPC